MHCYNSVVRVNLKRTLKNLLVWLVMWLMFDLGTL